MIDELYQALRRLEDARWWMNYWRDQYRRARDLLGWANKTMPRFRGIWLRHCHHCRQALLDEIVNVQQILKEVERMTAGARVKRITTSRAGCGARAAR